MSAVLELIDIKRSFTQAGQPLEVLKGCNLAIHPGELVALIGQSGSGKTTLLQMAGLLEAPTSGQILIQGTHASKAKDAERTRLRRDHLGFVYQFHHLLPEFTATENVAMPLTIAGKAKAEAQTHANALLEQVGLGHRLDHRPSRLSGGEQQRVAIARALANKPALLLADEPTGNLDPDTSETVFDLLLQTARAQGLAALIATHNWDMANRMDRVLVMQDGLVQAQS